MSENTISKTIHYCWFGRNPLPQDALKCIASWQKHFPDYEIKEWNEDNFDVNICQYTREAYEAKKYAFVSDYARFWILYNYGGIYFDTDVEVIRPMDDIISKGPFMGIEKSLATKGQGGEIGVAPGLGIGAFSKMVIYQRFLMFYSNKHFNLNDGTIVTHTTNILKSLGLKNMNIMQRIEGLSIYPADYFCPMDSTTGLLELTKNTRTIHHYSASWRDKQSLSFKLHLVKNQLNKIFGPRVVMPIAKFLKRFKSHD